jgi:hypothetical protein
MNRGGMFGRWVLIVVVLVATVGCSKILDKFREKHPDPPPGVFPSRVGKMVLDEDERWGKNPNCTRADPLHCWAYYILPGGDNEATRIHYYMQIYDSPEEAKARLEEVATERTDNSQEISWEDGGEKIGRVLLKNSVRHEHGGMLGYCSASYAKDSMAITIYHGYECDPARQFLKDLAAISD